MDKKLNTVCELVYDLVTNHNIKQNDIYNQVTCYLTVKAGDNKKYILYNTCYGGFSFSEQFREFSGVFEEREDMYDMVIDYGKHLADKYPFLAKIVSYYLEKDMGDRVNDAYSYNYWYKRAHYLSTNINTLEAVAASSPPFVIEDYWKYTYHYDSSYIHHKLEDIFAQSGQKTSQELISDLRKQLERAQNEVAKRTGSVDSQIVAFINRELSIRNIVTRSFITVLEEDGESNPDIWRYQSLLNTTAMRYIAHNPPQHHDITNSVSVYENIGLICAGGLYSCLKFATVPVGLSWRINEYDGMEKVIVD